MGFCASCGSALGASDTLCMKCGAPVSGVTPSSGPATYAPVPPPKTGSSHLLLLAILVVGIVVILAAAIVVLQATSTPPTYAVQVDFPGGCWTGTMGMSTNMATHDGCGTQTMPMGQCTSSISAIVAKSIDPGTGQFYPGTLTVNILKNGASVRTGSTSATLGLVSLSYSC